MVVSFPLSPKGPRSRSSKIGRQERMGIQLQKRELVLPAFCSTWASDGLGDAHSLGAVIFFLRPTIHMSSAPGNALTETSGITFRQLHGHPLVQAR